MDDVWKDIIPSSLHSSTPLNPNPNAAHHLASSPAILNWSSDHPQHPTLEEHGCPPVDYKYNRMMKNRQSAARSRSRRLLEEDKSQLTEENARIRKELEQEEQFLAAGAATVKQNAPKNHNLSRSLSALF